LAAKSPPRILDRSGSQSSQIYVSKRPGGIKSNGIEEVAAAKIK